jgi:medium-chain acyl-[acyl-carrier-protein] hydrolase
MPNESIGNWVMRFQQRMARPRARLFCIPHAGGGASAYRLWSRDLPADIEVLAVQLPGRETRLREAPLRRIEAIVEELVPALLPHLDVPFAIFGHSMGAVLAAATAAALGASARPLPMHLFLSARRAAHMPDRFPALSRLPDSEFVAELNRRYGGISPDVLGQPEILEIFLPTVRADIAALEAYQTVAPVRIPCPLTILGGSDDSHVSRAELEAWGDGATRHREFFMFPGDHFYVVEERAAVVAHIATTLAMYLDNDTVATG